MESKKTFQFIYGDLLFLLMIWEDKDKKTEKYVANLARQ